MIRLAAFILLLAGCTGLEPYATEPRPRLPDADLSIPRVGICYSALFSTPEDVRAAATEACSRFGDPHLVEQDLRLACPLLTPARATFECLPKP
jgi:hypothetical protein